MSEYEIFASVGKGRTMVKKSDVAALIDKGEEDGEANTLVVLGSGEKLELATKFRTVLKKFKASEEDN